MSHIYSFYVNNLIYSEAYFKIRTKVYYELESKIILLYKFNQYFDKTLGLDIFNKINSITKNLENYSNSRVY